MFERYEVAKKEKTGKWLRLTIAVSLFAHVVGGVALLIYSFWRIEKIDPKAPDLVFTASTMTVPPPPPPPPPPAAKSSVKKTDTVKPTVTHDLVQPDKDQKPKADDNSKKEEDNGETGGVVGGEAGGVAGGEIGGQVGGVVGSTGPATPPPPPAPPASVAQQMLEGTQIAGADALSDPPGNIQGTLRSQQVKTAKVRIKLCLDVGGRPSSVDVVKSSGYPELDTWAAGKVRETWRFRPYAVAGNAVPVCATWILLFNL